MVNSTALNMLSKLENHMKKKQKLWMFWVLVTSVDLGGRGSFL